MHRPDAGGIENIWSAFSPDLLHWGEPHCVLPERSGAAWDSVKVGAGPPPILTEHGWLLIYHGVKAYGGNFVYRVGVALLDRDTPYKVIARGRDWVFQAEAPYELSGYVPSVVFPTGVLVRGDELWMYYGAADSYVCLATARLDDVLAVLST
ncbi:MAG: glycoside hydrolase family 130 protein [Planctomycetota bacterium]